MVETPGLELAVEFVRQAKTRPEILKARLVLVVSIEDSQLILECVTERNVTEIVQQAPQPCGDDGLGDTAVSRSERVQEIRNTLTAVFRRPIAFLVSPFIEAPQILFPFFEQVALWMRRVALIKDSVYQILSDAQCAQRVREARMCRPGVYQMRVSELFDSSESLEWLGIDEKQLQLGQEDIAVDGVGDHLAGA
jgi:hypothetical protein